MKHYKVETLIYNSKLFANRNHIMKASQKGIQEMLDKYSRDGGNLHLRMQRLLELPSISTSILKSNLWFNRA